LQAFAAQTAAAKAAARGTRWSALPVLDFVGSWGANSLTGTGRTLPDFSNPDSSTTVPSLGGLSDALSDVFNHDFPTWSAGFRFSLPLGLRSERGDLGRDRAQVIVAEQQYERARRGLEVSVRGGCRELDHAQARVRFAAESVDASLDQVRIGRLEYRAGRTTAFELVRLATDLATSQQRYSQALVRAAKAAANLRALTAGAYPAAAR